MNRTANKAFILLDVLFGASLMIAVVLLCAYFRQMVSGFASTSADCRAAAHGYYAARCNQESNEYVQTSLLFSTQAGDVVAQRHVDLAVVQCKNSWLVAGVRDDKQE